jgi:hypothetical protein
MYVRRGQAVVNHEIERLPDLALAAFSISNEAEDTLIDTVQMRRQRQTGCDRQPLPERSRRRWEEGEALSRVWVAVDFTLDVPQPQGVLPCHGPPPIQAEMWCWLPTTG